MKYTLGPLLLCRAFTYYKLTNLDSRIANADQILTQDVEKFSNSIGELYSNLSKVFSIVLIYRLASLTLCHCHCQSSEMSVIVVVVKEQDVGCPGNPDVD